ncbi:MAG: molecular chaperone TorD family protein [Actinomycetota bacterium]|nr:molecular chaperone TorD family protein [Actinomycetota bacterium]
MSAKETGRLGQLFVDEKDVKFWKKEGAKHDHLHWVRAMISESPRFESTPAPEFGPLTLSAEDKARLYGWLAQALTEPTESFVESLVSSARGEHSFSPLPPHPFLESLKDEDPVELLDSLKTEYTRIFFDSYLPFIPPYESVYLGERQVMGEAARRVAAYYKGLGMGAAGEMPDHIAHECEFMALLYQRGELSLAKEFLKEHLLAWGPQLCSDLKILGKAGFYEAVAQAGEVLFYLEAKDAA